MPAEQPISADNNAAVSPAKTLKERRRVYRETIHTKMREIADLEKPARAQRIRTRRPLFHDTRESGATFVHQRIPTPIRYSDGTSVELTYLSPDDISTALDYLASDIVHSPRSPYAYIQAFAERVPPRTDTQVQYAAAVGIGGDNPIQNHAARIRLIALFAPNFLDIVSPYMDLVQPKFLDGLMAAAISSVYEDAERISKRETRLNPSTVAQRKAIKAVGSYAAGMEISEDFAFRYFDLYPRISRLLTDFPRGLTQSAMQSIAQRLAAEFGDPNHLSLNQILTHLKALFPTLPEPKSKRK